MCGDWGLELKLPQPGSINMRGCALWYARHGFPVFPCKGKKPLTTHGFYDATTDVVKIMAWWRKWPGANPAMPTGVMSGFVVPDIDPRHGGDESFEKLVHEHGPLPSTAESITGGGGRHFFFRCRAATESGELAPGIDLKADGGYVMLPPSIHPVTKLRYQWDGLAGEKALLNPADAPDFRVWRARDGNGSGNGSGRNVPKEVPEVIPDGRKHDTCVSVAGSMRRRGCDVGEIFAALVALSKRFQTPVPQENLRKIAASVCKYSPSKLYLGPGPEAASGPPPIQDDDPGADAPDIEPGAKPKKAQKKIEEPIVMTVNDVLNAVVQKPRMLIEEVLPTPGLVLVVAPIKTGKSLLALQVAMCVAARAPLFDYFRVVLPGNVLFVEKDDANGTASIQDVLQKTSIKRSTNLFVVTNIKMTFGADLILWLEKEIVERRLQLIVLDSFTALRAPRSPGVDFVKEESSIITTLDELGKKHGVVVILIHHTSKGSASLDWSERAAGSFAIGAAAEAIIFMQRFSELSIESCERLVRVRGRHIPDVQMALRLVPKTLGFEWVLGGPAAPFYPQILELKREFGEASFTPKKMTEELGISRTTAWRLVTCLVAAGAGTKVGTGVYRLNSAVCKDVGL